MNEFRPDLESLEILELIVHSKDDRLRVLHFPSMKVFKYLCWTRVIPICMMRPIPLEFGNLEEIAFHREESMNHWIEIILQNPNLKKISTYDYLNINQLERIENGLLNIKEIDFKFFMVTVNEIVTFLLRKPNKLKRVSFVHWRSFCDKMCTALASEWEKVENIDKKCILVRRQTHGK